MKKIKFIMAISFLAIAIHGCNKTTCIPNKQDTFPYNCKFGMDVAFVIDYTSSMGGAINNVKANVTNMVNNIVTKSGGDYQLSLNIYDEQTRTQTPFYNTNIGYTSLPASQKLLLSMGTTHNQIYTCMERFSLANNTSFSNQLAKLNTTGPPGPFVLGNGGFASPEPAGNLIERLATTPFGGIWRSGKVHLLIILTDAVEGGDDEMATIIDDAYLQTVVAPAVNAAQIQCILVTSLNATSNLATKLIANNTAGKQLTSANFANVSNQVDSMINNLCLTNGIR
jgi:hypothetical protein